MKTWRAAILRGEITFVFRYFLLSKQEMRDELFLKSCCQSGAIPADGPHASCQPCERVRGADRKKRGISPWSLECLIAQMEESSAGENLGCCGAAAQLLALLPIPKSSVLPVLQAPDAAGSVPLGAHGQGGPRGLCCPRRPRRDRCCQVWPGTHQT